VIDAQEADAAIGVALRNLHERRLFVLARGAPGRPRVDDQHVTGEVGRADRVALQVVPLQER
jgi:hypothetical protein